MSDQRRFVWRSGRLPATPLSGFWAPTLTAKDPQIPNLPLESPAGGGGPLPPGVAVETDTAFSRGSARPVGLATEADTALALAGVQLVGSVLTSGSSVTDGTTFTSASIAPTANRLVLAHITSQGVNSTDRGAPASVGGGNFTLVAEQNIDAFTVISVWRYLNAAPFSGTVAIVHANTQDDCAWSFLQFVSDTSGTNGSGAVGTPAGAVGTGTAPAPGTIAFSGSGAATYVALSASDTTSATIGTFTADTDFSQRNTVAAIDSSYGVRQATNAANTQQTTCVDTLSSSESWGAIGFEIKPLSAGGTPVGRADEADTAIALDRLQIRVTGRADETDTALPLAGVQARAVGLSTETDTALPLGSARPVGRSNEVDEALPRGSARPVGTAAEADSAFALAGIQLRAVGRADEADTALALAAGAGVPVGRADEIDAALTLAGVSIRAAGMSAETDTAISLAMGQNGPVGLAQETDTAFELSAASPTPPGGGGGGGTPWRFKEPRKERKRNLVYVIKDEPRSSATEAPQLSFAEARQKAEEIIKAAATEHAATRVSKQSRYGYVRASIKPLAEPLGNWNWVNLYQRMYDAAIIEQLKQQEAIADQLEEDSAVAFLLLNM